MNKVGLVLEGGGMRATFTAGVLDAFMRENIFFKYVIGVSAGASNSISYISRQPGRGKVVNIDFLRKYKYCGWRAFFHTGRFMDYDFLFNEVPSKLYPLDIDAFCKSDCSYVSVATNCRTGLPVYFEKQSEPGKIVAVCRASCSLPVLCSPVFIDGEPYLDGGVCDSIPVGRALSDGCDKAVVILTRPAGFRKPERDIRLPFFMYRKYPKFKEALRVRNYNYNRQMEFLENLEAEGRAFVIRPETCLKAGRLEADPDILQELYDEAGRVCSPTVIRGIRDFISG